MAVRVSLDGRQATVAAMGEEIPLSAASVSAALEEACEEAGLSPRGARLMRFGSHALYELPAAGVVVRVGRHAEERVVAEREVRVARWLAGAGSVRCASPGWTASRWWGGDAR